MFKAGAAQEIITPPVGTLLAGYAHRRESKGIYDELTVTAIALSDENTKALLISATLLNVSNDIVKKLKEEINEKFDIQNVIICATHTHSGPIMNTTAGWGKTDDDYVEKIFIPKTLKAAEKAICGMKEALLGIGMTESDAGINRRFVKEDGSLCLGENPWGIFDSRMHVVAFKGTDGTPICNIIHYGAHGTVIGGYLEACYISRDWSGVMEDRLSDFSGAITAFFNGAEGDVAPRMLYNSKDRVAQMKELGSRAGFDAIRAYRAIKEFKEVDVKAYTEEIKLPFEELPDLEMAKKKLSAMGDVMGERELEKQRWVDVIKAHEEEKKTHLSFTQNIISVGEIAFVPFPFEHFTEIALRLDYFSPYGYNLTLSNANGSNGYLPCRTEICRGGYEIWSFKNVGAYALADNTDDVIIAENLKLLRRMKEQKEN